jgi:hypothetical protein
MALQLAHFVLSNFSSGNGIALLSICLLRRSNLTELA